MRKELIAVALLSCLPALADDQVAYLNGVRYVWPGSQGAVGTALTDDGAGRLSWAVPPSPEGLWSGCIVLSTVAWPVGWTRIAAADSRELRAAAAYGGTGGADSHAHASLSGLSATATAALTGSTGSSGFGVSGSTGTESVSHSHGNSTTTVSVGGFPPSVGALVPPATVQSADPSHSHSLGSLSGSGHTHGAGTLALDAHGHAPGTLTVDVATAVAAYYSLIVCQRN